jgi:hypothetical protein
MKESERERVVRFLRTHVIGRAVVAPPLTTVTDSGRITSAYEEDAVYGNLVLAERGFAFDLTTLARGTRYVQKRQGMAAEGSLNAVRVLRYELTERASSGRLIGHARFLASTNAAPDPFAGVVFLVQITLARSTLALTEQMVGYADFPSSSGGFVPGAVEGCYKFSSVKGRLLVEYEHQRYDVDPVTLARKASGDKLPAQVSREVVFPDPDPVIA